MTSAPQKALIYCRVSDTKQTTDGHGLESQEHRCRQFAEEQGLIVEAEPFLDDVSGGGNFTKRPAMNELLDYLRRHKKTNYVVIFDDIKRFSRDVYFYWDLIRQLDEYNAQPMSPNFRFEKTPEGRFQQSITVAAGEYERESIARQNHQKTKARLEAGFYAFIAPVGFKFEKEKGKKKRFMKSEPAASVIAEMMEGFASGRFQTKRECKVFLETTAGFPKSSSGKIGNNVVDKILSNPLYAGYIEYKPWGVSLREGRHEGMVSYETFVKIQERLKGRAHAPARKDINEHFPLRGAVACECGNKLTSCFSKSGSGKHHAYYLCQNRNCQYKGKSIRKAEIEDTFETLLAKIEPSKELISIAESMFRTLWEHRGQTQHKRRELLEKDITQTEKDIEKQVDKLVETDNTTVLAALEKRIEKLEQNKIVLREKISHLGQPQRPFDEMYRTAMTLLANPLKLWQSGGFIEKRTIAKLVFSEPLIYTRNHMYRTPNLSLPFKVLGDILKGENMMVPRRGLEPPRPEGH